LLLLVSGNLLNKFADRNVRFFIKGSVSAVQSIGSGDTRMTGDLDLVFFEDAVVSFLPVIHLRLSFEVCDRKNDWNLFLTEEFVKEPVVALKSGINSAGANAK
jgi:hypothetical protein